MHRLYKYALPQQRIHHPSSLPSPTRGLAKIRAIRLSSQPTVHRRDRERPASSTKASTYAGHEVHCLHSRPQCRNKVPSHVSHSIRICSCRSFAAKVRLHEAMLNRSTEMQRIGELIELVQARCAAMHIRVISSPDQRKYLRIQWICGCRWGQGSYGSHWFGVLQPSLSSETECFLRDTSACFLGF